MTTPWIIALFAGVALAASVVVHFARWAATPRDDSSVTTTQPISQMSFWSIRELWKSAGGLRTVLLSLCLTITATLLGVHGAKKTNAYLEDNRRANQELNEASGLITQKVDDLSKATGEVRAATDRLLLHTRNAIPDFLSCKLKAEEMLESVSMALDSEVRLVVFWPMFGADSAARFQDTGTARFDTKDDCPFYRSVFARVDHNMRTEIVFLDHEPHSGAESQLSQFIDALGAYQIPSPAGPRRNFPVQVAAALKQAATDEITTHLIPLALNKDKVRLMVVDDLPVLLFIVDHGASSTPPMKDALLFIGNREMIARNLPQGGFYTRDPAMVDVLEGLFVSLSGKARELGPTAGAKP